MTENTETNTRAELARAHLRAAFIDAGYAPALATHVAAGAKIETVSAAGALVLVGELRAIDTPDSLAALAKELLNGPAATTDTPAGNDPASNEAARKAGQAAGQAMKAATSDLAFR